jgi:hypothetical protein
MASFIYTINVSYRCSCVIIKNNVSFTQFLVLCNLKTVSDKIALYQFNLIKISVVSSTSVQRVLKIRSGSADLTYILSHHYNNDVSAMLLEQNTRGCRPLKLS